MKTTPTSPFAILALASLALSLSACGPGAGASRNDPLAGPYRVLSVKDVFADAPKLQPAGDIKEFMRERLDWAYAPGRPPLAVMDPESDLRLMPDVSPDAVYAAEAALAAEGHQGAQLLSAMEAPDGGQSELKRLADAGFVPAGIFAGGFEGTMGDTAEAKANRDKLRKLADSYPMARMFLGLALLDLTDAKDKAEGVKLLSGLHDLDPLTLQTIVSSFYFMSPTNADADKAARQMLEAYVIALPAMTATREPMMQGAPYALATMLEEGRGGDTDVARATRIYGEVVAQSHASCEPAAAAALQRLGKPVPEGRGLICTGGADQMH